MADILVNWVIKLTHSQKFNDNFTKIGKKGEKGKKREKKGERGKKGKKGTRAIASLLPADMPAEVWAILELSLELGIAYHK